MRAPCSLQGLAVAILGKRAAAQTYMKLISSSRNTNKTTLVLLLHELFEHQLSASELLGAYAATGVPSARKSATIPAQLSTKLPTEQPATEL